MKGINYNRKKSNKFQIIGDIIFTIDFYRGIL